MKAVTEEKILFHKIYQKIYTEEATSKCQNLAENLKSELEVKACKGNSCLLVFCLFLYKNRDTVKL